MQWFLGSLGLRIGLECASKCAFGHLAAQGGVKSSMNDLIEELKRRNIFRVGAAYLVLSWLVLQIGSVLAPILTLPPQVLSIVVFLLVLGFPLALFLAWAFEMTPEGLKRSHDVAPDASVSKQTGQRLNRVIIGLLGIVIVVLVAERLMFAGTERVMAQEGAAELAGEKIYDSIAVLPFVNMSDDRDQEFFSDGISEELLNLLAKTRGLRVAARTSSFAFKGKNQDIKGIGEQLDVQTILEGSVRKAGTRLRITAQLIDAASGYHLWSETYDRELNDVFAIQDEISAAIVAALSVHLDNEAPVQASTRVNMEAYEHYLKGRELIGLRTEEEINQALDHFTAAVKIDPNYAPAWSGKADAYMLLRDNAYGDIPSRYIEDLVGPLVDRALELDPLLPDAHNSKAYLLHQLNEFEASLISFDRALELRPSFAMAYMWKGLTLRQLHRYREVWEVNERAHRIDPLSLVVATNVVIWRAVFGEHESALALAQQMESQAPDRVGRWANAYLMVYELKRDDLSAYRLLQRIQDREEMADNIGFLQSQIYRDLGSIDEALEASEVFLAANILVSVGRCDEAQAKLDGLGRSARRTQQAITTRITIGFCSGDMEMASLAFGELREFDPSVNGLLYQGERDRINGPGFLMMMRATGDVEGVARVEADIATYLERLSLLGLPGEPWYLKARLKALDDDFDGAIGDLKRSAAEGRLYWYDRFDPNFRDMSDQADFKAIFDGVDAEVNARRAELGWGPMEISQ